MSHIELLLNYCNQFYNRQFITCKAASSDLLLKLDGLLYDYFSNEKADRLGLPTVQHTYAELNFSPDYLSDMLRNLTGQNTQQHIHNYIVERAKEILTTTNLSVGEIAHELGFEYPQSFNKLFKNKTSLTPLKYRSSFN